MNLRGTVCGYCDGSGLVMGEYTRPKDGEVRIGGHRCSCGFGARFPTAPMAPPDVLRAAQTRSIREHQRIRNWYAGLGCDFDNDPEDVLMDAARKELRRMMDAAGGIFRKQKSGIVEH